MRFVPTDISAKLKQRIQTRANDSDISARIWINRPTTALTSDIFLERQTVLTGPITETSIAVCHPRYGSDVTKIWLAYISSGILKVVTSTPKTKMETHLWVGQPILENASSVSIAFDGTMPKNSKDIIEFVTDEEPWVFWAYLGQAFGRQIGSELDTQLLFEAGCTYVAAYRGLWDNTSDFGLILFGIVNGVLTYRQRIRGEWTDGESVTFGPPGVLWKEVTVNRTWDYRIVLQLKSTTNEVYEFITQFMGFGKMATDTIVYNQTVTSGMTKINNIIHDGNTERVRLSAVTSNSLYSILLPKMVFVENLVVDGDWGKRIRIVVDVEIPKEELLSNINKFDITDSRGSKFIPSTGSIDSDLKTLTLNFTDFNNAYGVVTVNYTPGTIKTHIGSLVGPLSFVFTPINLIPTFIPVPVVRRIYNV